VYNQTDKKLEVTARWGSSGAYKTYIVEAHQTCSFSPFIKAFYELVWRSEGDGVYHTLSIPSTRFLSGSIEIHPQGVYIINFNRDGVYTAPQVEIGKSPQRLETPNRLYPQALAIIKAMAEKRRALLQQTYQSY